ADQVQQQQQQRQPGASDHEMLQTEALYHACGYIQSSLQAAITAHSLSFADWYALLRVELRMNPSASASFTTPSTRGTTSSFAPLHRRIVWLIGEFVHCIPTHLYPDLYQSLLYTLQQSGDVLLHYLTMSTLREL